MTTMLAVPRSFGRNGRTGNQLWQIASTIGLADRLGFDQPAVPDDWPYRHVFSLPDAWYRPREECEQLRSTDDVPETEYLGNAFRPYLQDLELWHDCVEEVRRVFAPSIDALARLAPEARDLFAGLRSPLLAVHVRRGDNVTNPPGTINLLTDQFYRRAIQEFPEKGATVIFTDDPDYCEFEFADVAARVYHGVPRSKELDPTFHTEEALDWVDLLLMSKCTFHVLSNSTFSWWGAWLSKAWFKQPSRARRPVYPSYWYGEQNIDAGGDPTLMFPASWQQLDAGPIYEAPVPDPVPVD